MLGDMRYVWVMRPGPGTTCLSFPGSCVRKASQEVHPVAVLWRIPVWLFVSGTPLSKHGLDTMLYFMYYENTYLWCTKGYSRHLCHNYYSCHIIGLLLSMYFLIVLALLVFYRSLVKEVLCWNMEIPLFIDLFRFTMIWVYLSLISIYILYGYIYP
jgi:hypothetical protein